MASGGNTWFKKLEHKRKMFELKRAKGNEQGVMSYCASAKPLTSRSKDRQSIEDKPLPKGPKVTDKAPLTMREGWKPQPYMTPKMRKLMAKQRPVGKILRAPMKQW